jgi:Tol biopolymer transport system component
MKTIRKLLMPALGIALLILVHCDFSTDTEGWIEEKYPLRIMDANGENAKTLIEDGFGTASLYFVSYDKKILAIWLNSFSLIDIDSVADRQNFSLPIQRPGSAALSADGSRLAITGAEADGLSDLYIANFDGANFRNLTHSPDVAESQPSFSADGRKIVLTTSTETGGQSISYYDLEKDTLIQVLSSANDHACVNQDHYFWYPHFAQDDQSILFFSGESLKACDIRTKVETVLDPKAIYPLCVSKDGRKVVYLKRGDPPEVAIMSTDGSGMAELDNNVSYNCGFNLAQDGSKILIYNRHYGENMIYIVNSDGSGRKKLASGVSASFSSDATRIVFTAYMAIAHK